MSTSINPATYAAYTPNHVYGQPQANPGTNTGTAVPVQQQQAQSTNASASFSQPGVQQWANQAQPQQQATAPQQPPAQPLSEVDALIGEINQLTAYAPQFMQQQQAGKVMDEKNKALQQQNAQLQQQITMLQNGIPADATTAPTGSDPLGGMGTGATGTATDPLSTLSSTPPTSTDSLGTTLPSGEEDLSKLMNGEGYADAAAGHANDAYDIFNNFQAYAVKADTLYKMKTHYMEEAHTQGLDPASFEGQRYVKEKLAAVVAKDPSLKPAFDKMSLQYSTGQSGTASTQAAPVSTTLPSTKQAMNNRSTSMPETTIEEPMAEEVAAPRSANSALGGEDAYTALANKLRLRAELKQQLAEGKITQKEFDAQTGGQTFDEFTNLK